MFGSLLFQWLRGPYHNNGYLKTTNLPITEADANSATGILKRGKLVNSAANSETEMAFTDGFMLGILTRNVSLNGLSDVTGFKNFTIGLHDQPAKRGQAVTLRVPGLNAEAIFEGVGVASVDTLVITSGTGAIASGTARHTELSVLKGGWRIAQTTERVWAILEQANYTPNVGGNVRIRVRFVSPYVKP